MTNLFETREDINTKLNEQARIVIRAAQRAINNLSKIHNSELLPGFMDSSSGFDVEVVAFNTTEWIKNPHYKPGLSTEEYSTPANIAVDAGVSMLLVNAAMCNITATEIQDPYDDCAGDPETWELRMIPQQLFLYGSFSEVVEFFIKRYKNDIERENHVVNHSRWSTLFYNYTPDELIRCANAMVANPDGNHTDRLDFVIEKMQAANVNT